MTASKLRRIITDFFPARETDPREAYNLWATGYDDQPGNLVLDLDQSLFSALLDGVKLEGKQVADIGCGTGRHWPAVIAGGVSRLIGFDVSEGMLKKLQQKFPNTETNLLKDNHLPGLADESCDLLCSTLTLAHIRDARGALTEWYRVLRPGGDMLITDYHPVMLDAGGKRTFRHDGKLIKVKSFVHPVNSLRAMAKQLHLEEMKFMERQIDESVENYYQQQGALEVYRKYKGVPLIYGIHLKKNG